MPHLLFYTISSFCKSLGAGRVEVLAAALKDNDTVEWLDLQNNPLKIAGARALSGALADHPSVLRLEYVSPPRPALVDFCCLCLVLFF